MSGQNRTDFEPASAIAAALATRIEALVRELLPMGRRIGHEWKIGSIEGEEGDSMGVVLDGRRRGIWKDLAWARGSRRRRARPGEDGEGPRDESGARLGPALARPSGRRDHPRGAEA
jgi:hypothetical protein